MIKDHKSPHQMIEDVKMLCYATWVIVLVSLVGVAVLDNMPV